ncbi:MAG: ATP-dependent zinc metalloprotease FtsH [Myxococcota bacterium]
MAPPNRNVPPPPDRPTPRMPPWATVLAFVLLLVVNYLLVRTVVTPWLDAPAAVSYTRFKEEVIKGNVDAVYGQGDRLEGHFRKPITWPPPEGERGSEGDGAAKAKAKASPKPAAENGPEGLFGPQEPREVDTFSTTLPYFLDPGLEGLLIEHGAEIRAEPLHETSWTSTLCAFAPAVLLIGAYFWMFRRANQGMGGMGGGMGGVFGLGRSRARRYDQADEGRVTFADVAGIDEAENELVEIVDFLKDPEKYTRLGGSAPKGVLLIGAPGTGKTLLARAVAGEAGVPFFSMSGSEFVEMIVGVGAARVRDLFQQARDNAPSIIFIDEVDSIGRARGAAAVGGSSEQEQTLNQILTEMDGFSGREGIIVLAATNQPDVLDRALLRPGRFDRRVVVNLPDRAGRRAILEVHTRAVPLGPDVDLDQLGQATPGLSGADLKNLVNEAALLAARRDQDSVHNKDFLDALEKIVLGPERPLLLSEADRERIAYHEGGHAILGLVVPGADPVNRVSIVPRGQALGVTYQRPQTDRYNYPEAYLEARIVGMLGGRAAEELVYGTRTTGAENDIEQATELARGMVTRWGMSDALGLVQLSSQRSPYLGGGYARSDSISDATAEKVDAEVARIIGKAYDKAKALLSEHRGALDALVAGLLAHDTLDEAQVLEVTGLPPAPALDDRPTPRGTSS